MQIREIHEITQDIDELATLASGQGFESVRRLVTEHLTDTNRFNKPGEVLFGAFNGKVIVGVGGLNVDPYEIDPKIGRLRRFYVKTEFRRHGVGTQILHCVEERASNRFSKIHLFTPSKAASNFYESMGYERQSRYKVSHAKQFGV